MASHAPLVLASLLLTTGFCNEPKQGYAELLLSRVTVAASASQCDPSCTEGMRCTCEGCKEVKTTTTATIRRPHSAPR